MVPKFKVGDIVQPIDCIYDEAAGFHLYKGQHKMIVEKVRIYPDISKHPFYDVTVLNADNTKAFGYSCTTLENRIELLQALNEGNV
jgi:hypothetical protein